MRQHYHITLERGKMLVAEVQLEAETIYEAHAAALKLKYNILAAEQAKLPVRLRNPQDILVATCRSDATIS